MARLEHCLIHQRVAGSVSGQGHIPRLRFQSLVRASMGGNQSMFLMKIFLSLSPPLFLPPSLSLHLSQINKNMPSGEEEKQT